ncbi:MAG: right-handed parallel beta-helix repeat-containing protein [Actinomycetota bacterium]
MEPTTPQPRRRRLAAGAALLVAVLVSGAAVTVDAEPARAEPGRTFHVSPDGDDANDGTSPDEAWETIDRVNLGDYQAGDQILFEGGATFTGAVLLTAANAHGKEGQPVVVGSHGDGRATITTPAEPGLSAVSGIDVGGVHVTDLVLTGADPALGGAGVLFGTAKERLADIAVVDTEITGFSHSILVNTEHARGHYRGIRIEGVVAHGNASGPTFFGNGGAPQKGGANRYGIRDLQVANTQSFDNDGAGLPNGFGGGITAVNAKGVRIEDNLVHDNGGNNPPAPGANGPMGIVVYGGRDVVVQRNEVYHQRFYPPEPTDSAGIDVWANGAVIQHNFVHDNEGWGMILASEPDALGWVGRDNVVRYNVFENNGRLLPGHEALPPVMTAQIFLFGAVENYEIHNNVFFARALDGVEGDSRQGLIYLVDTPPGGVWAGIHIRNNLFLSPEGEDVTFIDVPRPDAGEDLRVEGNAYIGGSSTRRIIWADPYESVETWSDATGQEMVDGALRAVVAGADAVCDGVGAGSTQPGAYLLPAGSPLVDAAIDLRSIHGLKMGTRDFFGNAIPAGTAFDIGAHERGSETGCG